MKKTSSQQVGGVILQYLRETGLETPLNEYRLIQAWETVMGPAVAKYTKDLKIYNQVLFVTLSSAALRNELLMRRTELTARLNSHVGAQVITQIVLR
ncbi:MAG: DciA family protein [Bacteroidaceae bacterium]